MNRNVKRFVIGAAAAATLVGGVGVAALATPGPSAPAGQKTAVSQQQRSHEAEARGRVAEGEAGQRHEAEARGRVAEGEAGPRREAEARGRVAEGEQQFGDDHGANQGADHSGRGHDGSGHRGSTDRGGNRGDG